MPQASNLVIAKDGIPNNITFSPVSVTDALATFQDKTATLLAGRGKITLSHRLATSKAAARTRMILKVPVEELVDGVNVVTRESTAIVELITAPGSTASERSELRVLASNALINAVVTTMVDDGEQVFG